MPYHRAKSFSSARKQKNHRIKIKITFSPHREYTCLSCIQHIFSKTIVKSKWKYVCFTHATCPPTYKGQYWHNQDTQEEFAAVTVRTLNHNPKQTDWAASNLLPKPASLDFHGIIVGRKVGEKGMKHLEKKDQWPPPCVSHLLASAHGTSSLREPGKGPCFQRGFRDLLECRTPQTQLWMEGPALSCLHFIIPYPL